MLPRATAFGAIVLMLCLLSFMDHSQIMFGNAVSIHRRQQPEQPGAPPSSPGENASAPPSVTNFDGSIYDYLVSNQSSFGNISTLLNETGIPVNSSNFTLFAPNNQAFEKLPGWITQNFNQSVANSSALPVFQALMLYHIHPSTNFTAKNFSILAGTTTQESMQCQSMRGAWLGENVGGNASSNATTLSTAMKPLNLTVYTSQAQQDGTNNTGNTTWWVNDAQVLSVINTTSGYLFELSKVVTPMYYFNSSVYDVQSPPPPLGQNYTFPTPMASPPPVNLSVSTSAWMNERRMRETRALSLALGFE